MDGRQALTLYGVGGTMGISVAYAAGLAGVPLWQTLILSATCGIALGANARPL